MKIFNCIKRLLGHGGKRGFQVSLKFKMEWKPKVAACDMCGDYTDVQTFSLRRKVKSAAGKMVFLCSRCMEENQ